MGVLNSGCALDRRSTFSSGWAPSRARPTTAGLTPERMAASFRPATQEAKLAAVAEPAHMAKQTARRNLSRIRSAPSVVADFPELGVSDSPQPWGEALRAAATVFRS